MLLFFPDTLRDVKPWKKHLIKPKGKNMFQHVSFQSFHAEIMKQHLET